MQFFGYWRSSAAYRCRIAFNLKGVEYAFQSVHLRRNGGEQHASDYVGLNPQHLVPTLVSGERVLGQSLAIIEWLDETHPGPRLLPANSDAKAMVRWFSQIIACDIHPLQNLRVLQYLEKSAGFGDEQKRAWCQTWISQGLAACEALLAERPLRQDFCFGDAPGLADICLVPQIYSAERFGVELLAYPRLIEVYDRCQATDAFETAHPQNQPDADAP